MRYRINEQLALTCMPKRGPEGPLAAHLQSFAQVLSELGYTRRYLCQHLMLVARFSHWLGQRHVPSHLISNEHVARYLRYRHRDRAAVRADSAIFDQLMAFLRTNRLIPQPPLIKPQLSPAESYAHTYARYLREDRGLAKVTIISYVPFITDFLKERFGSGSIKLSSLSAKDVVQFVQSRARRLHVKRAKLMTTALRSFFQYVRMRGQVLLDLAAAVPVVANWSMTSIPRAIAPEQTQKLLTSIDQKTAMGKRNYAILLLLARLGMRAGEVASLKLDDIDWDAGRLRVCGKGGRPNELPLPAEVGGAIAQYLQNGRPRCADRHVFLRTKAPVRAFHGSTAVGLIVKCCLKRAHISAPTHGAHQFRHGLASDMLREGASLAEIGAVLGHRNPDTTRIYTKIDLKALRKLAQPWPRVQ